MERWAGRVAVVTGASAGIGAGIARHLVLQGLRVVGLARRVDNIKALAEELRGAPGELVSRQVDLTNEGELLETVRWIKQTMGGMDVLVNNAGVFHITSLTGEGEENSEVSIQKWRRMLDLNIIALSILTREAVKDMKERGVDDGHIVHIGSVVGQSIVNFPGGYMYSGTKHAVRVMTEGLRRELRDSGSKTRVSSISPALVRTEWWRSSGLQEEESRVLYEENPCLEVEDIANAVEYVLSCPPHVQIHELSINPVGSRY